MARVGHLSDWHLDSRRRLAGGLREVDGVNVALTNTAECVREVAAAMLATGPLDVWLLTGDLTDTPTPTQIETRMLVELVEELARSACVVVVAGNHDAPSVGAGATSLEALKLRGRVVIVERPTVLYLARDQVGGGLYAMDVDQYQTGRAGAHGEAEVAIACLPYPRRAELIRGAGEGSSKEERYAYASSVLRGLVQAMRGAIETVAPGAVRIAAYHGTISGATVGKQPRPVQGDIELAAGDFAGFHYTGVGHIHRMQQLAGPRVCYAGSIDRVDFDEAADFKGGLDVQVTATSLQAKPVRASKARRYVTLEPAELDGYTFRRDVVYRVKAAVTTEAAVEIRRKVADVAGAGVWIAAALDVEAKVRVRDELARSDESTGALMVRWLDTTPAHAADIAAAHGGTDDDVRAELLALNHAITGGR